MWGHLHHRRVAQRPLPHARRRPFSWRLSFAGIHCDTASLSVDNEGYAPHLHHAMGCARGFNERTVGCRADPGMRTGVPTG